MLRARTIVRWEVVAALAIAGLALGGVGVGIPHASAQVTSQTLQPAQGGTARGAGLVLPLGGGGFEIALTGATPLTTYQVSSCQTAVPLGASTCQSSGASSLITTDVTGQVDASVQAPLLVEIDSIEVQSVTNPTDLYIAVVGPVAPSTQASVQAAASTGGSVSVLVGGQIYTVNGSALLAQLLLGQAGLAPYLQYVNGVPAYVIPSSLAPAGTCPIGLSGAIQLSPGLSSFSPLYPVYVSCP